MCKLAVLEVVADVKIWGELQTRLGDVPAVLRIDLVLRDLIARPAQGQKSWDNAQTSNRRELRP